MENILYITDHVNSIPLSEEYKKIENFLENSLRENTGFEIKYTISIEGPCGKLNSVVLQNKQDKSIVKEIKYEN